MAAAQIDIASLSLYGGPVAPNGFHFTKLDGWYDVPDSKAEMTSRPQAHGSFRPGFDWREGAKPSVEGWFGGSSHAEVQLAKRLLNSIALVTDPVMTVTDTDGPTSRVVSVRFIDIDDDNGRSAFGFSFDTESADPFRYGPAVASSTGLASAGSGLVWPLGSNGTWLDWGTVGNLGRANTPNAGNAPTFSQLSVTGGLGGGFLLTYVPTGAQIKFNRQIPLGSTVTLDPRTGRAVIDGQSDVSGYLTVSDWWPVQPGEAGSIAFAAIGDVTGTPMLTASTPPAIL